MSPTPLAGWVLGIVAVSAIVLPIPLVLALFAAVLAATAADAWAVREPPQVTRTMPPMVSRTVPADFTVEVEPRSFTTYVRQPSVPDVLIEPQQALGALTGQLTATRRGRHDIPHVHTRTIGVLRLGQAFHRHGKEHQLLVYPDMPAAYRIAASVRVGKFSDEGSRTSAVMGLGTEFESIREYLPDDDIRQVNWRASARTGRPMSNQFRLEQNRDVIILMDSGRLMASPVGPDRTRMDAAVDAATSIALVADQIGDRCGLVSFDNQVDVHIKPNRRNGTNVVHNVYSVEASPDDSDYEAAFRRIANSKRAFVIILTDLVDEAAAQSLLESVGTVAKRHEVTVASIADSSLAEVIRSAPVNETQSYGTLVAIDMLEERNLVAAQLRHRGATVIEAPFRSFSTECVRAYLRAKTSARL